MWRAASLILVLASSPPAAGADIERGRAIAASAGCTACHTVPGAIPSGANVGPPLRAIGRRVYLAGMLPNTPENMARWITQTQAVRPGDAMPSTPLDARDAEDLVAFLMTLR